ncbi:MAG: efflux RND transporter periplasmic adaptor subunit [Myxococcaceae bacterium]
MLKPWLVLPVLALLGCSREANVNRRSLSVVAQRPTKKDLAVTLSYPAELKPLRQTEIQPLEVHGFVTQLLVDRGHSVKVGQVLAKLDCTGYADDRAKQREALRQLEARHEFARQTLERLRPMAEQKYLGAQDLAKAQTEATQADAALGQAAATLRAAETRVKDCVLTAPFDGDITARHVDVGARVGPGVPLFTLVDGRTLRATVHLVDLDAGKVHAGQPAALTVEAFPGRVFEGRVERVVKALDRATRTLAAEVDISNDEDLLRPGLFARVKLTVATHPGALLVPAVALLVQEEESSIYLTDMKTARRQKVKLGFDDGEWVEILEGVSEQDRVVVAGKDLLGDGAAVEVTETAPAHAVDTAVPDQGKAVSPAARSELAP